jgi:ribulose-phosphate 3-epimerase
VSPERRDGILPPVPDHRQNITPPIAAPSILSADFARLPDAVALADPARDWVHCDVMDNHFVPNLTFGPLIVAAVRKLTPGFVDVHLMIERPERLVPQFAKAGADQITIHVEAAHDTDVASVLALIRRNGVRAGLALRPGTRFDAARPHLSELDVLMIMTVEPGFGGQAFMADMLPKVSAARDERERGGWRYLIEVDGGIAPDTAREARAAGADVFVAGSAVYHAPNPPMALAELRQAITP